MLPTAMLLTNAAATWLMTGVIWTVQVVHYPLFARVGVDGFIAYEKSHTRRIGFVVIPAMVIELVTTLGLIAWRPLGVTALQVWLGVGLLGVVIGSTALWQGPMHPRLALGFDAALHGRLVASNWVRTIGWSARGGLVFWMIASALG
jgi:hypothetical protein